MSYVNWELVRLCLTELSQPTFREQLWLAQIPKMQGSFEDCVEELFGDSGLLEALERRVIGDVALYDCFRQLETLLNAIGSTYGPAPEAAQVLRDPRMGDVTSLAQGILPAIKAK